MPVWVVPQSISFFRSRRELHEVRIFLMFLRLGTVQYLTNVRSLAHATAVEFFVVRTPISFPMTRRHDQKIANSEQWKGRNSSLVMTFRSTRELFISGSLGYGQCYIWITGEWFSAE